MESNVHLKGIILCLFFWGVQFTGSSLSANVKDHSRIVCIHSYASDYSSYTDFNLLIEKELSSKGLNADIRFFYLDCERYQNQEEIDRLYNYIETIQSWKPDIILVNEDQATYSLLCSEHPLVLRTPIVFSGVNFPNWELLKKHPHVTGFWDKPEYEETCEMITHLMGKSKIRIFYDNTFLGRKVQEELISQIENKFPQYLSNRRDSLWYEDPVTQKFIPIDATLLDSDNRPDSTIILMSNFKESKGNQVLWTICGMNKYAVFMQTKYDYTTMRIGQLASIPTFTVINEGFGYKQGVLGGYITSLDIQVEEAIDYVSKILKGEKVENLPITQSHKEHILDWEELKRWNIPLNSIPDDYRIINLPLHERYPILTFLIISVFSVLIIATIVYLTFLYIREAKRKKVVLLNLWKEKEFLSLAFEDSNIFTWRYDAEYEQFNFDKDFFGKLKMSPKPISLQQLSDMIMPEDQEVALGVFYKVRDKEENQCSIQCRCDFNGKGYIWYEYRYINTIDSLGKSSSIIGLIINIQEYKDKEAALIEARDLAAKAELKQSFLANMSHEIRTPLNAIVGFSNLLVNEKDLTEEEQLEFITIVNKNCDLLLKLINDILEISRIESGNMTFLFEACDLASLLEDIYATHALTASDNVELRKEIPPTEVSILTDLTRLNQVITNFVNNAIKFTAQGHITIGYKIIPEKDLLQIYVKDTGRGIPTKEQKMIFERFYKQDEFAQGTGLGLSISQIIVERLGGKIDLKSEETKGSCFTISFPYSKVIVEDKQTKKTKNHSFIEKDNSIIEKLNAPTRATILIAEDTDSNYMLLKTLLGKHFRLLRAMNGKEAIEITKQQHIDLILMDIKMPSMNGIDALVEIRKNFKDLPIVMQTAYAFEQDKENAIMAGCTGFLSKPIARSELQKIINDFFPEVDL